MIKIFFMLILILLVGCNEAYRIKMKDIDTQQSQALLREKLSREDHILLRHARLRYNISGRREQIRNKTVGDLIKEQKKLEELALDKRLERQKKLSKYIALERSDSSRYIRNNYYLETKIINKSDKTIKTLRFKVTLYQDDIAVGVVRRFQSSDINLQSGSDYFALHRITAENKEEEKLLTQANRLYIDYEPIAIIFSDGSSATTE